MAASPLLRRHDPASQTRYQDLKQLARSQRRVLAGTPGTLKHRTQAGKRYWVREYIRVDGRKTDEYIGAEGAIGEKRLAELRTGVDLAKALASGSSTLRVFGYQRIERKAAAVLAIFFNRGLHQAGLTLVGSHAYGVLLNELGLIAAGYRTQDIDVARAQPLAVTLPDGFGFKQLLDETGLQFVEVPVKELGAHAQTIPMLDFLVEEPLDGVVLSPNQVIPVRIPSPERFVLHKLYSSQSRKTDRGKARKDLEQAAALAAAVEDETPGKLRDAFRSMPAGGKRAAKRGAQAAAKLLKERHTEVYEVLAKF